MAGKFIDISVVGIPELQAKLKALGINTQNRLVKAAAKKAMAPVLSRAKQLVPKRERNLEKSLKLGVFGKKGKVGARVMTSAKDFPETNYYAGAVEFGTSKMRAQPYLRPALLSQSSKVLNTFGKELGAAIEKEARK
ncbi:MAG TPA: HK97-gp10 family putative phage morphogenesis protein [Planctomycetota bacterium]|nr:HK97-gp10 family putative phage morphogenesis protein [Planctomycetota bacterium]